MSNPRVVKTSKLIDSINIGLKKYDPAKISIKEYDLSEIAIDSDNSKAFSNKNKSPANIALRPRKATISDRNFFSQTRGDDNRFFKLYTPCVGSKSTQVVGWDKSMTTTIGKLEEVHADLWGTQLAVSIQKGVRHNTYM